MKLKVTIYLDVISPPGASGAAGVELKKRTRPVDFEWKIALMDASGFRNQSNSQDGFLDGPVCVAFAIYVKAAGSNQFWECQTPISLRKPRVISA